MLFRPKDIRVREHIEDSLNDHVGLHVHRYICPKDIRVHVHI